MWDTHEFFLSYLVLCLYRQRSWNIEVYLSRSNCKLCNWSLRIRLRTSCVFVVINQGITSGKIKYVVWITKSCSQLRGPFWIRTVKFRHTHLAFWGIYSIEMLYKGSLIDKIFYADPISLLLVETYIFMNLMFIGPCIVAIVDEWKTNLMTLVILFHLLCAQHVSDINITIFRILRLCWWITTSVVLFSVRCVLEFLLRLVFGGVRFAGCKLIFHLSTIAMMHGPTNIKGSGFTKVDLAVAL